METSASSNIAKNNTMEGVMQTPSRALRTRLLENVQQMCTPLKIPASPFMKNLGYGTCVNVYKLERSPRQGNSRSPWAVKRVSKRKNSEISTDIFNERIQKEAAVLRKLQHPNIVGFRGITKSSDGLETLILECCKTSLGSILEDRFEDELGPLPHKHTLKMIRDICSALNYLHTEAKILHGDLKSYNILVKGDFETCKLCDFGVSLPLDENGFVDFKMNPQLRYVGTDLWSAPEILDENDVIDCKADIFSFGLIVYETIALVPPHTLDFKDTNDESGEKESIDASLTDISERMDTACGTRPPLPQAFELADEYKQIIEIFYCCTTQLAENRPTAKTILEAVNANKEN